MNTFLNLVNRDDFCIYHYIIDEMKILKIDDS